MAITDSRTTTCGALDRNGFTALLEALRNLGFRTIGPVARDGAIVWDDFTNLDELPAGWRDLQSAGNYRIEPTDDPRLFAHHAGPLALKRWLSPARRVLWTANRNGHGRIRPSDEAPERIAFVGIHPCDLASVAILDQVFLREPFVDPYYRAARDAAFLVVAQCTDSADACFCASTGTGPRARAGFDLAITEVVDGGELRFLVEAGSEQGREVLASLPAAEAAAEDLERAEAGFRQAEQNQMRRLETDGLKDLLYRNAESPHWDSVASRCLACGNCTMACPTCFCTTVEVASDLAGANVEHVRVWDSCFNADFSYIHGGSVRRSLYARYRQWMTHKLAAWQDQFGTMGCVGCGRCIAWCPAGIDITEEARALRLADRANVPAGR